MPVEGLEAGDGGDYFFCVVLGTVCYVYLFICVLGAVRHVYILYFCIVLSVYVYYVLS